MNLYIILDDFFDDFFNNFQNTSILQNVCFSFGKTKIFKIQRFNFSMFFQCVCPSFFGIDFYMDFSLVLEPCWLHCPSLFNPLGYLFGVDCFMIFGCRFGSLLAPKTNKSKLALGSRLQTFFSGSRFRGWFSMEFN